jgi:hypothetical protein
MLWMRQTKGIGMQIARKSWMMAINSLLVFAASKRILDARSAAAPDKTHWNSSRILTERARPCFKIPATDLAADSQWANEGDSSAGAPFNLFS